MASLFEATPFAAVGEKINVAAKDAPFTRAAISDDQDNGVASAEYTSSPA